MEMDPAYLAKGHLWRKFYNILYVLFQFHKYHPNSVKTHSENSVRKKYCILVFISVENCAYPKHLRYQI